MLLRLLLFCCISFGTGCTRAQPFAGAECIYGLQLDAQEVVFSRLSQDQQIQYYLYEQDRNPGLGPAVFWLADQGLTLVPVILRYVESAKQDFDVVSLVRVVSRMHKDRKEIANQHSTMSQLRKGIEKIKSDTLRGEAEKLFENIQFPDRRLKVPEESAQPSK